MTSGGNTGERILGSLEATGSTGNVRIEDRIGVGAGELWSALTDPARLAIWMGQVTGDLTPGGEFRAHFFASGWEGTGRVEACEPQQRLVLLIGNEDEPEHPMEVSLTADGDQTVVVWEERGVPAEQLPAYGAGVQIHVEDLAAYLAGRGRCDARARFEALFPAYRELAAGIG